MTSAVYEPERFRSQSYQEIIDLSAASGCLNISPECLKRMQDEAEAGYPLEICGLLIGNITGHDWQISDIRPVANLNRERAADRFALDPAGYQAIDRELRGTGSEIVGVYHSHPDCPARPSPTDLGSAWEGFAYPIISVCDGKAAEILCWSVNSEGDRFKTVSINHGDHA